MRNVMCSLGIHRWVHTKDAKYKNGAMERLGVAEQEAERRCEKCGKVQRLDVHCLGLNPPDYVCNWMAIKGSHMEPLDKLKESLEAIAEHHADRHDPESAGSDIDLVVQVYFSSVGRSDITDLIQSVLVYR